MSVGSRLGGRTLSIVFTVAALLNATGVAAAAGPHNDSGPTSGSYPVGVPDPSEPSGMAPLTSTALPGYQIRYVTDFVGSTLPSSWDVFTGVPSADPGGHFGVSHVVVAGGLLTLETYRDRADRNRWVTGGLCQCGLATRYGAYFVRSRITGPGPNEAELLWPKANVWPPEVDFNETGGSIISTTTSLHYGPGNHIVRNEVNIGMTKWHTWGVIWTRSKVTYTVDGRVWGTYSTFRNVPHISMTLDFEQREICSEHRQCPTHPVSMEIDWVAEYAPNSPSAG